jgi:hypothetical protein
MVVVWQKMAGQPSAAVRVAAGVGSGPANGMAKMGIAIKQRLNGAASASARK